MRRRHYAAVRFEYIVVVVVVVFAIVSGHRSRGSGTTATADGRRRSIVRRRRVRRFRGGGRDVREIRQRLVADGRRSTAAGLMLLRR